MYTQTYFKLVVLCMFTSMHATYAMCASEPYQAIVSVPVADLVGQPFCQLHPDDQIHHKYDAIPFDAKASSGVCPRLHQLLLHEYVTVIDQKGDEVCVLVPHIFFITHASKEKQTLYWTLKKNIIPVKQLQKNKVNLAHLPEAITFEKNQRVHHPKTVALAYPYLSDELGITLSAGTRFVTTGATTDDAIEVYALHGTTKKILPILLPKQLCVEYKERSQDAHINLFVHVLQVWAHPENGCIPYVWGGCSFGPLQTSRDFTHKESAGTYWFEWPSQSTGTAWGVDCAGLVARAAHIAGIPYFYKNTTTLAHYLQPVTDRKALRNGDLIWIPGHVMIISDVTKNLIIEARCYKHGFGKVHEIELGKIFKGIPTFTRLMQAQQNNEILQRLHKNGTVVQSVKNYKLLSIESAWDFTNKNSL